MYLIKIYVGEQNKGNRSYRSLHLFLKLQLLAYFSSKTVRFVICAQRAKRLERRSFSNIRPELFLERNTEPSKRDSPKKMAACALSRGLLSIVSKYNRRQIHRVLSIADSNSVFEVNRPPLQCQACGLSGGVQLRRFMSSR